MKAPFGLLAFTPADTKRLRNSSVLRPGSQVYSGLRLAPRKGWAVSTDPVDHAKDPRVLTVHR